MLIILQKAIAASGYCSRRKAEELIRNDRVKINGQAATLGAKADPEKDKITINNRLISRAADKIYLKLNKPIGYTCTNRHFPGEKNIFDLVNLSERLFAVGRLDKDSRGLILLTNDGDLAQHLTHPKFEQEKNYEVKIAGQIDNPDFIIKKLIGGLDIGEGDGLARAKNAKYLQNGLFVITLNEGKKRQIRRMFQSLGIKVRDLKRTTLGGLSLGTLSEGRWEYLPQEEIMRLKNNKI
ncbi:TPA: pseudouridine synthase [Candidatus Falkowbacteria bacterium]|nr:MAG: Pseudouridine synthase [Candidatus Falkowbacteria bacterium GW2011_GWF2_43_32]HBA37021.1 pseudouridine synthase [Candidatus Falkowbacteria bacterium]